MLSLASLSAGVTPRNFARNTQFGRRNQFITVEGGRDSSTNYTIDGVYVRSLRFNNLSLNPPVDAVQEVSLLRNSFSTEYGQGQAVVSIVTKSGTNQLHGSAYEFYRGDRFDAKNFFAPTKPEYERNAFGGTGGGPIVRNKILRVWRLRGIANDPGTAVPRECAEPGVSVGRLLRARHADSRSAYRTGLPGQRDPESTILEIRKRADADDTRAEYARERTTTR